MGIAIAIKTFLQPYIHNIISHPGTAIAIDLFLLNNNNFRIIFIYFPSNNTTLLDATYQKILNWIEYANKQNL